MLTEPSAGDGTHIEARIDLLEELCGILALTPLSSGLLDRMADERFDWDALISLADHFLLVPALAFSIAEKGLSSLPPPEIDSLLTEVLRANEERTRRLRDGTLEIVGLLNEGGIVPLVMKGGSYPFLSERLASGWRTTVDLDILVSPEEDGSALSLLERRGFRAETGEGYHHHPVMFCRDFPFGLELHTCSSSDVADDFLKTAGLRSEDREVDGKRFKVPDPTSAVLLNIVHAEIHHEASARFILQLREIHDLALLCRHLGEKVSWETLRERFRERDIARLHDRYLDLSRDLFRWEPPRGSSEVRDRELRLRKARFHPFWARVLYPFCELRSQFFRLRLASLYGCRTSGPSLWLGYLRRAAWLAGRAAVLLSAGGPGPLRGGEWKGTTPR